MGAPRVCPECGEEYVATALQCVECGVALVAGDAGPVARARELPPVSELVLVRAASLDIAQGLSAHLSEAGITHRLEIAADLSDEGALDRPGANLPYGVYVREVDLHAAREIDRAFLQAQIPDLPLEVEAGGEGCPACGASVATDATECPDCGLALIESA